MPAVSKEKASQQVAFEGIEVRLESLEGGYSVCFESHTADADLADLFRGLPDDRAQLPRWGYVLEGKVGFRFSDREETYEAGDAYYVPPGHTPVHYAGAEIVEFSPTEILGETIPVVMRNLQAAGVAVGSEGARSTDEQAAPPEAWDTIAEGYDRYVAPQEVDLANDALRLVGLEPAERFLDVAAGTGGLSLPAARLGAEVVATDWSPAMIERFEARVREEGLTGAEGRVMDCHALDLPDDSFDVTASQFGVMLVPDQPRALREMVRVTKPGGRVLVIAYASPGELEFLQIFIGALTAVAPEFPGLPDDPPPLEFQVADPDVLRRRLVDAGLQDVRVERSAERPAFRSGQEMWDWVLYGNPIPGMLVADLTEEQRARLREVLDGMLRERSGGNGPAVLNNAVNIGIGTK